MRCSCFGLTLLFCCHCQKQFSVSELPVAGPPTGLPLGRLDAKWDADLLDILGPGRSLLAVQSHRCDALHRGIGRLTGQANAMPNLASRVVLASWLGPSGESNRMSLWVLVSANAL